MYRLRFVFTMFGCLVRPTRSLMDVYEKRFIAWPFLDTDVTRLFTQTYSQYLGLCRWHYMFSSPFRGAALKRGWVPVTTAETIQYKRAVKAFNRVAVRTRMLGWTEKRFYLEQVFLVRGEVRAICHIEGVIRGPKGAVEPKEAFAALGFSGPSPAMPPNLSAQFQGGKN
ncbi:MAG: acyl-CoA thioesterase [Bdellovibrionota bacterium]